MGQPGARLSPGMGGAGLGGEARARGRPCASVLCSGGSVVHGRYGCRGPGDSISSSPRSELSPLLRPLGPCMCACRLLCPPPAAPRVPGCDLKHGPRVLGACVQLPAWHLRLAEAEAPWRGGDTLPYLFSSSGWSDHSNDVQQPTRRKSDLSVRTRNSQEHEMSKDRRKWVHTSFWTKEEAGMPS